MTPHRPTNFQNPKTHDITVTCVKDVAKWLSKSESWVYKNRQLLGGVKVGGALFFPSKEKIYERLFQQEEGMVGVLFPISEKAIHRGRIQEKKRRPGCRSRTKKGGEKTKTKRENRHGLLNAL